MFSWRRKGGHVSEADLSAFADGALSGRPRASVESHVATCAECASLLADLRATKTMLSRLPRPETQRSFTLGPSYATAARARPASPRNVFAFAPAIALSVLVLLLAADLLPGGSSSSGGGSAVDSQAGTVEGPTAKSSAGAPPSPFAIESQPVVPPQVPGGPASNAGGPTPAATGPRDALSPGQQSPQAPPGTPAPAILQAPRTSPGVTPPAAAGGAREGFAPTPIVPREPLKSTGGSEDGGGLSTLRLLEIVAALAFVASLGAYAWDRRRAR